MLLEQACCSARCCTTALSPAPKCTSLRRPSLPPPLPLSGLLDLQRAQEWVVTTKLGSSDKRPGTSGSTIAMPSCRLYMNELVGGGLGGCCCVGLCCGWYGALCDC